MRCLAALLVLVSISHAEDPTPPPATEAAAVITDRHGGPVPERVPVGSVLVLSAKQSTFGPGAKSVLWRINPDQRAFTLYDSDSSPVFVIPAGLQPKTLSVELVVAKGDTVDAKSLSIEVYGDNTDPRPPPNGDNVNPQPAPPPQPVQKHALRLTLIRDLARETPENSAAINASKVWKDFSTSGHSWAFYQSNHPTAVGLLQGSTVRPPCLVIQSDNGKSAVVPLAGVYELIDTVTKWERGQ
ncbi:MAG: hypothetical protein JSS49_05380 [Planctomycetes bacterium]|nr:hypothetical protein [Planctomycetota bacterium]